MPFWTVEDACPYKEKSNILMRTSLLHAVFLYSLPENVNNLRLPCRKCSVPLFLPCTIDFFVL